MFRAMKEQSSANFDESSPKQPIARPTIRPLFESKGAPDESKLFHGTDTRFRYSRVLRVVGFWVKSSKELLPGGTRRQRAA